MLVLTNTAGASATTPPASKTTLFVDATGVPSTKSSGGTVVQLLSTTVAASTYVDLTTNQTVGGIKTFTGTQLRIQSTSPGFWQDETDGSFGMYTVLDAGNFQIQQRDAGFGGNPVIRFFINLSTSQSAIDYNFGPRLTNTYTCGTSTRLWTQIFATNATINTSDARLKTEPRQLKDAEFKAFSAVCRLPPVWRWLSRVHGDERCAPEGQAARKHFGPTVQAAMQVFADNGLNAFENAPFCYDEWEAEPATYDEEGNELTPAREAGDRYSLRKEELLCGMVNSLAREIDEGKAENAELRGQLAELADRLAALEAKA